MAKRKNHEGTWGKKTINGHQYHFFRVDGKYFYGKTVAEVNSKIEKFKEENQNTKVTKTTTLYEFAQIWLESKKNHIKIKTYDGYEFIVEDVLTNTKSFDIKNKQIKNITKEQMQKFIDGLGNYYAKSTIQKTKTLLNQIFDMAEEQQYVSRNFMKSIKLPSDDVIKVKTKEIKFLQEEDIKILERLNESGIYSVNAQMIIFILHTGLRISEAIGLRWEDVDEKNKKIFIRNNRVLVKNRKNEGNKTTYINSTTKTDKGTRIIPLSNKAMKIINDRKGCHKKYVFTTINGTSMYPGNVETTLHRMLKRGNCSINKCGVHSLRHTFGSILLQKGTDIKTVSELLGHSDISVTYNIYIHILQQTKIDAINVFNS